MYGENMKYKLIKIRLPTAYRIAENIVKVTLL